MLVFTGDPFAETTNLWMSTPALGLLEEITTNGSDTRPIWSPIEPVVAMVSRRNGNLDVWLFDTTSGQYTDVTAQDGGLVTNPSWSWDGTQIAYIATFDGNKDSRSNIWITDLQTGEKRNLTSGFQTVMQLAWSPVDNRIAFISLDENETNLWVVKADGTNAKKLTG